MELDHRTSECKAAAASNRPSAKACDAARHADERRRRYLTIDDLAGELPAGVLRELAELRGAS
jgi:hypothetical protein